MEGVIGLKTPNISTVFYYPSPAPTDNNQLGFYIEDELRKISATIQLLAQGHIDKTTVAPNKPREGDIRLADGSSWNPGSGAGIYCYYGSSWHYLG